MNAWWKAVLVLFLLGFPTTFAQMAMELEVSDDVVAGRSVLAGIPMVASEASVGNAYAFDEVLLTFRCDNDGLAIYLRAKDIQTFYGYPATIIYRFAGGEPSTTHDWAPSTSGRAVFLPAVRQRDFYALAMSSETVAVRWTVSGGMATMTFVYDLREFQERAVPALEDCLG